MNSMGLQHLHCTSVHHCAPYRAGVRKICGFVVRPGRLRRRDGSPIRASLLALVTDVLWSDGSQLKRAEYKCALQAGTQSAKNGSDNTKNV